MISRCFRTTELASSKTKARDKLQEAMQPPQGRSSSFSSINIKATFASLMSPRTSQLLKRDLKGDVSASSQHLVNAEELDSLQDVYADTVKDGTESDRSSVERKQFEVRLQVRA